VRPMSLLVVSMYKFTIISKGRDNMKLEKKIEGRIHKNTVLSFT